jgi:hypothetical protein
MSFLSSLERLTYLPRFVSVVKKQVIEDPVIAEAIVDRLIHPSQKITLKGEKSYREKLTEKRSGLKNNGGLR